MEFGGSSFKKFKVLVALFIIVSIIVVFNEDLFLLKQRIGNNKQCETKVETVVQTEVIYKERIAGKYKHPFDKVILSTNSHPTYQFLAVLSTYFWTIFYPHSTPMVFLVGNFSAVMI